ncbi:MAG: LCP family protein [Anaerolineae bacterium]
MNDRSNRDQAARRNTTGRGHVTPSTPVERNDISNIPTSASTSSSMRRNTASGRARERMAKRRQDRALPKIEWTWGIIAAAVGGALCLVTLVVSSIFRGGNVTVTATAAVVNGVVQPTVTTDYGITAWNGDRRFTILVMGLDKRPGEEGTGFRTDSLILVSINPKTQQIGLLSIPRDTYVAMPNQPDLVKVNRVYVLGELNRPGDGPKLLVQTMQYNLGMRIDSYVAVSFDAVIKLVDAIGGIDINVPAEIDDPEYPSMDYGYEPLYIPAGIVHMDGQLALKYARTRHGSSDFARAERQQEVIMAMRARMTQPQVIASLVPQALSLWTDLSQYVITDVGFDQALSLAWYLKDLPSDGIRKNSIFGEYLQATSVDGDDGALVINRSNIAALMTSVFGMDYNQ